MFPVSISIGLADCILFLEAGDKTKLDSIKTSVFACTSHDQLNSYVGITPSSLMIENAVVSRQFSFVQSFVISQSRLM